MSRLTAIGLIVAIALIGTTALARPSGLQAASAIPAHHASSFFSSPTPLSTTLSTCDTLDCPTVAKISRSSGGMMYVYLPLVRGGLGVTSTVPTTPIGLSATPVSSTSIHLSWSDQATNELGFRIEQSSGLGFNPILTVGANITQTTMSGLSAATTYTYQVRAFNTAGYSGYSNQASATTLAAVTSLPSAPAQLIAVTASTSSIELTWLDKATDEAGFKIEQATGVGGASFSQVKLAGANVTNTIVTGLLPGTSYTFRVRAYNTLGHSGFSNLADAVTRATGAVPAAPGNLTAITLTPIDRLGLDWTDNSTNETEFIIESSRAGTVWKLEGGTGAPNIVSVDVTELLSNTRYCFRVRAHNSNGDSYPSNTACATTATATPPAAPVSVTLQTISSTAVLLTWVNLTNNNGYKVYESENGGSFALLGTLNQGNLDGTYIYGTVPGNTYAYKVSAFNAYGDSLQSATSNTVTAPAPAGNTVTRFRNNAAYPIVSLQIDGVEQFPAEPQGIPTSAVFEKTLSAGQHTYRAATGFWSYGSRVEMYVYNNTFTQQSGVPSLISLNNPSLGQILTRFGSAGYYVGEFWSGTIINSKGFRFYSNGTCTYYLNGAAQAGACSTALVSYLGNFIVTFNVTYSQGTFQASLDERTGTFYLQNGPSDWRTIQYTYDGY
ncbi:Chitinase A1 [Thermoflexales bacterium]|nr:Chitinase A1 [Thermoflexales bacterium]